VENDAEPLDGTGWVLSPSSPLPVDLGDVEVTAEFAAGRMAGTSGCNRYTAGYAVDGSSLTIGPGIAVTRRWCGGLRDEVERAYLERLERVRGYAVDDDGLTFTDELSVALLVFVAVTPS
jgi:heat shock protein HslJ